MHRKGLEILFCWFLWVFQLLYKILIKKKCDLNYKNMNSCKERKNFSKKILKNFYTALENKKAMILWKIQKREIRLSDSRIKTNMFTSVNDQVKAMIHLC